MFPVRPKSTCFFSYWWLGQTLALETELNHAIQQDVSGPLWSCTSDPAKSDHSYAYQTYLRKQFSLIGLEKSKSIERVSFSGNNDPVPRKRVLIKLYSRFVKEPRDIRQEGPLFSYVLLSFEQFIYLHLTEPELPRDGTHAREKVLAPYNISGPFPFRESFRKSSSFGIQVAKENEE